MEQRRKRDSRIDFLRAVGIVCIILAHVDPPGWLSQLRTFDVVLMVVVNGMSFRLSWRGERYLHYLWKRCKRLLLPTYLFLVLYLIWLRLLRRLGYPVTFTDKLWKDSFNLTGGIGYIWVVRVFFLMAVLSPLLYHALKRFGLRRYLLALAATVPVYELVVPRVDRVPGGDSYLVQYILIYLVGYGWCCAIGICMAQLSDRQIAALAALMAMTCLALAFHYHFVHTATMKYPPRLYQLSYGLAVSLMLCLLTKTKAVRAAAAHPAVQWLSKNSFRLYFWHVAVLSLQRYEVVSLQSWYILLAFVMGGAVLLTIAHNRVELTLKQTLSKRKVQENA